MHKRILCLFDIDGTLAGARKVNIISPNKMLSSPGLLHGAKSSLRIIDTTRVGSVSSRNLSSVLTVNRENSTVFIVLKMCFT